MTMRDRKTGTKHYQNIRGWVVTAREEEELDLLELVLDSQLTDHVDVELLSGVDPGPGVEAPENHLHWPA